MSYCKLITFVDGKAAQSIEYRNAWGGAARIWDALFNRYLKDPANPLSTWLMSTATGHDDLWALAKRKDLSRHERAVHASTFDWAIIRQVNFIDFASDLRRFAEEYPAGDRVCHLREWADFIDQCEAEAIGFHGTSVSENLWEIWDDGAEEPVLYNLNEGEKHFEVYEELNSH